MNNLSALEQTNMHIDVAVKMQARHDGHTIIFISVCMSTYLVNVVQMTV